MSGDFDRAFAFVVGVEGNFGADPADRGNWTGGQIGQGVLKGTKFGISAAAFPLLDIANITLDQARGLYLAHYWIPVGADHMPYPLDCVVFDAAVSHGVHGAIVLLQRSVATNPDGVVGPLTLAAIARESAHEIVIEFCARRALAYAEDPKLPTDGLGWMRRVFHLIAQFLTPPATDSSHAAPAGPPQQGLAVMNVLAILEGIISSVPEAIQLYHKVAPMISARADIHPDQIDEINALVPQAHAAVETAHQAISALINSHGVDYTPPVMPAPAQAA